MKTTRTLCAGSGATLIALATLTGGGCSGRNAVHPAPLGATVDPFFQKQEENAEASDFVIHEHEFQAESARLNDAGETHLQQIAARVENTPFPVIVAQSHITPRPDTTYGYAVHRNEALDMQRRAVVAEALMAMGVKDAERRVVVGHPLTPGFRDVEAERAYGEAFGNTGSGAGGGFGGGGGGFF